MIISTSAYFTQRNLKVFGVQDESQKSKWVKVILNNFQYWKIFQLSRRDQSLFLAESEDE